MREDREDFELKRSGDYRPPLVKQARRGGSAAASRVFVSNLSFETTWKGLKDHFNPEGTVVYADVMTVGLFAQQELIPGQSLCMFCVQ